MNAEYILNSSDNVPMTHYIRAAVALIKAATKFKLESLDEIPQDVRYLFTLTAYAPIAPDMPLSGLPHSCPSPAPVDDDMEGIEVDLEKDTMRQIPIGDMGSNDIRVSIKCKMVGIHRANWKKGNDVVFDKIVAAIFRDEIRGLPSPDTLKFLCSELKRLEAERDTLKAEVERLRAVEHDLKVRREWLRGELTAAVARAEKAERAHGQCEYDFKQMSNRLAESDEILLGLSSLCEYDSVGEYAQDALRYCVKYSLSKGRS